jgi:DNA-binding MurR/RpiR family transcriptional regulator
MNFEEVINSNYEKLTKSERRIAQYILNNKKMVIYGTMSTIKNKVSVGDATIVRFSKKLGFSGFNELKIFLAKEELKLESSDTTQNRHYYDEIAVQLIDAIKETSSLIDEMNLKKAVKMISESKKTFIFGVGHSGEIGKVFSKMLLRIGLIIQSESDPHFQSQMASMLSKNDLIIAISLSGATKDVFDSVKTAKSNGASIICITNNKLSPIAQISDVILQTSINEFLNGGSLAGQLSQLYICETLVRGYEHFNKIDTESIREKALRSIMNKRM